MSALEFRRPFGPLSVFPIAFGAGHIGDPSVDDAAIGHLLNDAVDAGVNLFDTAVSYGASEDRIRRHLAHRRADIHLSTKVGYGVEGVPDWTGPCVRQGIDQALRHLGTDYLDVVHLHSCPIPVLEHNGVVEPLVEAVHAGKVRVAAYSGDNDALVWAIDSGAFGAVQASMNLIDVANRSAVQRAQERGLGTLIKRPLANAVWRHDVRPEAPDQATYWDRWRALALPDVGHPWPEVALRFALDQPGVSACLVGTTRPAHLRAAVAAARRGPLSGEISAIIEDRRQQVGAQWPALI